MSRYMGTVESGVLAETKNGSAQIALKVRLSQEEGGDGTMYTMQNALLVNAYLSLSDRAMEYTEQKLKTLGFNGDFENPAFSQDAYAWTGKAEEYEGRTTMRYELADWGAAKSAPAATAKLLTAKWKQKFAGAATPRPPAASKPPATRTATPRDKAWAAYCVQTNNAPNMTDWAGAVADRGDAVKRTEAGFTPADWAAVTEALANAIPF